MSAHFHTDPDREITVWRSDQDSCDICEVEAEATVWPDEFGPAGDHLIDLTEHRPDNTNPNGVGYCAAGSPQFIPDGGTFWCTRPDDHPGRHAAGTTRELCAVWS